MARPPKPPAEPPDEARPRRRRTGISQARTYRPRGRTVRELPARPNGRAGDPFRPTLQVVQGGRDDGAARASARTGKAAGGQPATGARGKAAGASGAKTSRATPARARPPGAAKRSGSPRAAKPAPKRSRSPRKPLFGDPRRRLRLATVLALTMFLVLGARLVELQLTDGPAAAAERLQNRLQYIVLPAPRGTIYDRDGAVLAHSVEARSIFADPTLVEDPEATAAALQPLLGVPASELADRMRPRLRADGSESRFEWLQRRVDISVGEAVAALNLPGIGVERDERRIVPGHDLAANVIGFTGEDLIGLEGLEARYDEVLRGVNGRRTYESGLGDLAREIPGGYVSETPAEPGSDLRLTLDMDLQHEVQRVLAEALRPRGATFGAAVVLDARTFEVLAMASYPTYNAADPWDADANERRDVATAQVVDPGSSHKPFVFGAALEEGVITPDETLVVGPTIRKGDETFSDRARPFPEGTAITLPAAMAYSSNVATIQIADELGAETLYEYQQAFGLGQPTGVGMPGEAAGLLLPPAQWSGSSYGSVPIGHSVAATPLQMAAGYAAIANDGVWMQPRLVQAVIDADGVVTPADPPATRRVLSPSTAAALREIMEAVVTVPDATGVGAAVESYRVAGKTGTGQLVVDGEYAPGEVASFIGMAPAESPRYVVAVFAHLSSGGNAVVTSAFREMMGFTLKHYRIPPSTTEPPEVNLHP